PAPNPARLAPPPWPATSGSSGRSSLFTGCATPRIKRTNPRSEPEMAPGSWLLSATSQSGHSTWPDAPTSPKPPDGPDAPWTAHSPSSDSHHDLGTAVRAGLTVFLDLPRRCPGLLVARPGSSWSARSRAAARTNELDAGKRRKIIEGEEGGWLRLACQGSR